MKTFIDGRDIRHVGSSFEPGVDMIDTFQFLFQKAIDFLLMIITVDDYYIFDYRIGDFRIGDLRKVSNDPREIGRFM